MTWDAKDGFTGRLPSIAGSILHQYGVTNLIEMADGLAAWEAAKLPVVSGS
jgi:rhodanese-related sulfurtransferase